MLKIGELSKICNVSASTLRFYDAAGVLCPDYIDEESGYRYYSEEKVQTFRKIETLKEMNFSLDEIKQILDSSESDNLYVKKIHELAAKITDMKWQIVRMKKLCGFKGEPMLSLAEIKGRFENDPEAVGRWVLCGELTDEETLDVRKAETKTFHELYFLPKGAAWWMFFWSKGVLYRMVDSNMVVSDRYEIFERGGEKYMVIDWSLLKWNSGGYPSAEGEIRLLYRQAEAREFSASEAQVCKDAVDLPFVPDEELTGTWEVCDLVRTPDSFDPKKPQSERSFLAQEYLNVKENGVCLRKYEKREAFKLTYTRGFILNRMLHTAEKYVIREIRGEKYLIVEHKSGDYIYGGEIKYYYVFKKKKEM
ncbi:MAG: MerR family transcriptional regulator [Clostridia bacterium]|nr:MerR family transcriptional regulator [Clostridia bacterium]